MISTRSKGPPDLSLPAPQISLPFCSMKAFLFIILASFQLHAAIQIGEKAPNLCWTDEVTAKTCIQDSTGKVQVLLYSTGWCPDCQKEMPLFIPEAMKYNAKDIVFISLSIEGWKMKAEPSAQFLSEWKDKFKIPFATLASPKDPGRLFFEPPFSVPSLVILDKAGMMVYRTQEIDLTEVFQKIDSLL